MLLPLPSTLLLLTFTILNQLPTPAAAVSPSDLPIDTPISQILSLASTAFSSGSSSEALEYYSLAISRDPSNYLTFFKRGATYLSLGRSSQASADFDKCLTLRPRFEGALVQRGKIKARIGDWDGARGDYQQAGGKDAQVEELTQAEAAAMLARDAEKKQDWDSCISEAGTAVMVAPQSIELRRLRAGCRTEKGEVTEALSDLQQILKLSPGGSAMEETALAVSAAIFFGMAEREKGVAAVKQCLHSDPENKKCGRLFKREKRVDKELKKVEALVEKRTFSSAVRILTPSANGEEPGLIATVKDEIKEAREQGILHPKIDAQLVTQLLEMTCNAYTEMNNAKRAAPYCNELLAANPTSLPGLLHKAQTQIDGDDFEGALQTLNTAAETHGQQNQQIQKLSQKAQTLLKRSKQKDYYKVLGVSRDASYKEIKKAYMKASKIHHPDKVSNGDETARKAAEKKMIALNEAYEVLKDSELRARFDAGDDPNDPQAQARGHGGPFQGSPFGHGAGGQQFFFKSGGGGGGGMPFGGAGGGMPFGQQAGGGGGGFQFNFPF